MISTSLDSPPIQRNPQLGLFEQSHSLRSEISQWFVDHCFEAFGLASWMLLSWFFFFSELEMTHLDKSVELTGCDLDCGWFCRNRISIHIWWAMPSYTVWCELGEKAYPALSNGIMIYVNVMYGRKFETIGYDHKLTNCLLR